MRENFVRQRIIENDVKQNDVETSDETLVNNKLDLTFWNQLIAANRSFFLVFFEHAQHGMKRPIIHRRETLYRVCSQCKRTCQMTK